MLQILQFHFLNQHRVIKHPSLLLHSHSLEHLVEDEGPLLQVQHQMVAHGVCNKSS